MRLGESCTGSLDNHSIIPVDMLVIMLCGYAVSFFFFLLFLSPANILLNLKQASSCRFQEKNKKAVTSQTCIGNFGSGRC